MIHSPMFRSALAAAPALLLAACAGNGGGAAADSEPQTVTVLTYNIWHDQQDWPARRDAMIAEIREANPDLIGLQEVIQRAELPNQAETIAEALGYDVYFVSVDPPGADKRYGNAILTRYPIVETNERFLDPADDYRTAAHAVVNINGMLIDFYDTHLHHTREGGAIRAEQIADLRDFIAASRSGEQAILVGDFNAAPDYPELAPLMQEYTDTFALFVEDPLSERHATLNHHLGHSTRRIDYVFLEKTEDPVLRPVASEIILDDPTAEGVWPSDHFGVLTQFVME